MGEVQVGMRLKARWTYGQPVKVIRLISNAETGRIEGFEFEYEENFSRHFRPWGKGRWMHEDMLHWEILDPSPQAMLAL